MEPDTPPKYRPLSGTEYSWYRAVPTGTGITVLALRLSKPLPIQTLQTALDNLQNSHPILASALSPTSLHPAPPVAIRTNPLPPRAPLHSILERELNLNPWSTALDPTTKTLTLNFFATVYEPVEPAAEPVEPAAEPVQIVVLRFHTAVCDRTSAVSVLKEVLGLVAGEGRHTKGINGKGEVGMGIEEMVRKDDGWKGFWAKGRDLFGYGINGLRSSGLGFEDVGGERASEVVRLVVGKLETARLLNACKAKGVKLCGALAAAGLVATYSSKHLENDQAETYSIVTLIDCRKFLDPILDDHDIGFYHSAILNTHTIHGGEGFWEVALRCHNAYSNAKSNKKHLTDIGELNYLMCKAIDNPQLTPSSSLRTAVISVFEEPVIYESSKLHKELGVEDYVGCASVHGVGPSIAIFDTIRDGQLDCACVYPSPLHSRKQITDLVEHMKQILTEQSHDVLVPL